MTTSSKISKILRTALVIGAWAQGSVTVGVAAHLSKPSERASNGHGRCRERRDCARRRAEDNQMLSHRRVAGLDEAHGRCEAAPAGDGPDVPRRSADSD